MGETRNSVMPRRQWIEKQSELIGKHIHHALCGHGGEFCAGVANVEGDSGKDIPVDGYEPESKTYFSILRV